MQKRHVFDRSFDPRSLSFLSLVKPGPSQYCVVVGGRLYNIHGILILYCTIRFVNYLASINFKFEGPFLKNMGIIKVR